MSSKYRIVKVQYEHGKTQYIIESKWLFWWIREESWDTLSFAQQRVKELISNKIVSEEVVE